MISGRRLLLLTTPHSTLAANLEMVLHANAAFFCEIQMMKTKLGSAQCSLFIQQLFAVSSEMFHAKFLDEMFMNV